jgi:hypothetical protein
MAATKGAKAARFNAYVGKVNVAIDHVSNHIANSGRAEMIGRESYRRKIRAVSLEQAGCFVDGNVRPRQGAIKDVSHSWCDARDNPV